MKSQDMFLKNQQIATGFDLYLSDHPEVADHISKLEGLSLEVA